MNWVIRKIGTAFWQVGYYDPKGEWIFCFEYKNITDAATQVHYLNGGEV